MATPLMIGIDVGSTTVKLVAAEADGRLALGRYERHRSDVRGALAALLEGAARELGPRCAPATVAVTGSAGIG